MRGAQAPREDFSGPLPGQGQARGPMGPLLTPREVADLLQVSEKTVSRLVAHRRLPCVRFGRSVRFLSGDVLRWLAARKEG